jgi:branched-subunit amino acid aminotransferase/4-amino-4-deoxychorismate lyase
MQEREPLVWLNGEMVRDSEAKVSIHDSGFTNGDAAYDAFRTYGHRPFRMDLYFDRFFATLHYLGIDPGIDRAGLARVVRQVLDANLALVSEHEDLQIVLRCTRGARHLASVLEPGRPTLIVYTPRFRVDAPAYFTGVDVVTASVKRTPRESVSPRGKTHDRLNNILADLEAKRADPNARSLMLDTEGNVAEGTSHNIAAVIDGAIVSPKDNCLAGRTMHVVFELAAAAGIPARYDTLSLFDLYNASEAFITASSYGMLPVRTVDRRAIGSSVPGPVQERIWKEWDRMVGLDVREQASRYMNARPDVALTRPSERGTAAAGAAIAAR